MDKQRHTLGPWKVLDGAIVCEHVNKYGNFHIARFGRGDEAITEEDEANARLIAAAPDLIEACEAWMVFVETDEGNMPALEAAVALTEVALAKAVKP